MAVIDTTTGEVLARSLDECEAVIERGLGTFVEVGEALLEIRDRRLYQIEFSNFDAYCRERWGFNRQRAHQLVGAAEVSKILDTPPPTESHAAALSPLKDQPEEMRDVMEAVTAEAEANGERVTAERITEKVTERIEKTQPKSRTLDERRAMVADYDEVKNDTEKREAMAAAYGFASDRALRMYISGSRKMIAAADNPLAKLKRLSEEHRIGQITDLADDGFTSRQIAKRIGVSFEQVRAIANRNNLVIPADDVVGKARLHDSERIVNETVIALDGSVMALGLINFDELDPAQCAQWATSISDSLRALTRFSNQLKEMARDEG